MAENKNMKVDDEIMKNATGGTAGEQPFAFAVGDKVTLKYYDQIGTITEAYRRQYGDFYYNMYAIHWHKDPYNEEHDQRDVLEENLKKA